MITGVSITLYLLAAFMAGGYGAAHPKDEQEKKFVAGIMFWCLFLAAAILQVSA